MIGRPERKASPTRRLALCATLIALVGSAVLPAATLAGAPQAGAPQAGAPQTGGDLVKAIVTFKDKPGKGARDAAKAAGAEILREYTIIPSISVELPEKAIAALRKHPLVASVELDGTITAFDHVGNTGDLEYENAWGVEHIGTKPAHDAGVKGQGIKVAVIDTGIDYIHDDPDDLPYNVDPEFLGNYSGGYDFFNNDADPLDDNGHGTHVSGILAADKNGYLIVGVAPEVDLYALKVLGADGSGEYSGLIAALDWAVANDMDVVNMSLGGHEVSNALQLAIGAAYDAGITLVAASGNAVTLNDLVYGCPVAYPAAYDEVIAVSFTNSSDKLTGFSCKGPQIDLAAPGNTIISTVPIGTCMFCAPQGYKSESGTSMASPHVAGVAALILSKGIANDGDLATLADDVKSHLCATASLAGMAVTDPRYTTWYGCGIVDANQAIVVSPPTPPEGFNHAPAASDDAVTIAEDTAVDVAVLANDTDFDGDTLTVTAVTAPSGGSAAINPNGTVHYVPSPNANGTDSFGYTVDDGAGGTDTATVMITVNPVNDPPVAIDDALVTTRDTPSTLDVLANDSDLDSDPLILVSATDPAHGTVSVEANGLITYFPDPAYNGSDGFDYTISDGAANDAGHVAVTVTATNHAPVAVPDSLVVPEDGSAALDPVANDTDQEGGALTLTGVTAPSHGSADIQPDGTVRYTPNPNYHGSDSFGYSVADGAGAVGSGVVSVSVTSVNDAPVAVDDAATLPEDTSINIAVAANDTDVDGDPLRAVSTQANIGAAVVQPNGSVTYTPPANFSGSDSFTYVVSDGAGGTDSGVVSVTVTAMDDPPTADPLSTSTDYQTYFTLQVTGHDGETCELTFQIVALPTYGTLGTKSNVKCAFLAGSYSDYWKVKYVPAAGFTGVDTFTYRVWDGISWSAPATVTVTVSDPLPVHVGDLDRSKTTQTTSWTARVTVRVDGPTHAIEPGVVVTGTWSNGFGTGTCTSSSVGTCTISKAGVPMTTTVLTFSVTNMTLNWGFYQPTANHDPDGDSNGTTIQVFGLSSS